MRWLSDAALAHLREPVEPEPGDDGADDGRYQLLEEIGHGGMGTVYRARDRDLDREVAIKVLPPGEGGTPRGADDLAARLLREARVLAHLEHPGIVPVHDAGTLPDGRVYYAMRLVRGPNLRELARTAALPDLLKAFERVLDAVAFAHAHGVIHRDLKPENVLVGPFGDVLVMDWGIAKVRAEGDGEAVGPPGIAEHGTTAEELATGGTADGTVLGTPGYMPPEQARGEGNRVDERADVYALGAMLRALLPAAAPRPLAGICERATAASPGDRYAGASGMAADLGRYRAGLPVEAYREGLLERAARLGRRYRVAIVLVLTYLAVRLLLILLFHR